MTVRLVFRCEFCGVEPGPETHASLKHQLLLLLFGEWVDAEPENWLTWHGRGIYGAVRYACAEHRDSLKADVRKHYGALGWHAAKEGPHPDGWHFREDYSTIRRRRALARSARFFC